MTFLIILLIIIAIIAILIVAFANKNLNHDDNVMKRVWKAGYEEKQVTLPNGTVLNYGEGGKETSTPLFLIHGQGQAWKDYDTVLPDLAQKFHVYAVDCHGHGQSSHDTSRYNCKLMTEDFIWFIQNIIGKPCVISGHSSGGILAANVAALAPESIKALVIEDAPFFCVEPTQMEERNACVWLDGFKVMHEFKNQTEFDFYPYYYMNNSFIFGLFGNFKNTIAASILKRHKTHPKEPLKLWYIPQSMLRGMYYSDCFDIEFSETFYNGSWFDGTNQEEVLKGVKCPCTYLKAHTGYVVNGKPQPYTKGMDTTGLVLTCANTEADSEHVVKLVNGCKKVVTPTSDHLIHCKYPETFINEISTYC